MCSPPPPPSSSSPSHAHYRWTMVTVQMYCCYAHSSFFLQTCQSVGLPEQDVCADARGAHTQRVDDLLSSRIANHHFWSVFFVLLSLRVCVLSFTDRLRRIRRRNRAYLACEHLSPGEDAQLWIGARVVGCLLERYEHRLIHTPVHSNIAPQHSSLPSLPLLSRPLHAMTT